MKKVLVILLGMLFSGTLVAQKQHFDFSAVCSSGQTLYYKQVTDKYFKKEYHIEGVKNPVEVTAPHKMDGWYSYNYDGFTKPTGNVTIPSQVTYGGITYTVAVVGQNAFVKCENLKSVIIPNTVKSIGREAFQECFKLNSVTIPNSVEKIDDHAFESCSALRSIDIPNSVKEIGDHAFQCSGLKSIQFPNTMTEFGTYICSGCMHLESVVLPTNLQMILNGAFNHCKNLKSITIPNSVKEIYGCAFEGCSSLSIKVPNTVTYVDGDRHNQVFKDCLNVIYHGNLKDAPWGAKCLNGYVEGGCVYKDKTKKTLVAVSKEEEERRQEIARAEQERKKIAERNKRASDVNLVNIMNYVEYVRCVYETMDRKYYHVEFRNGPNREYGYIIYCYDQNVWKYSLRGDDKIEPAKPNIREGAILGLWLRNNEIGRFD